MESSLFVFMAFLVLLLITNSMTYDRLLNDRDAFVFIEYGEKVNGTKIIIDGDISTCQYIESLYRSTLYIDFTTVKSVYEVVVNLYLEKTNLKFSNFEETLSINVTNSISLENGSSCNSTEMKVSSKNMTVKVLCRDHGRFITMLPFRKGSLSICDITVTGCDDGMFGENCTKNCSENCVGKSCDILNGKCLSRICSDGWQGEDCNQKCYNGTYGPQCKSHCGNCTKREDCDHVTGYCIGGCNDGSKGNKCDTACLDGTHGSNCKEKCGKCRGPKSCDKASGVCLNGCENGYFGEKCVLQCLNGTYGYQCNSSCGNCKDISDCDHETGNCKGGCAAGSTGVKCDEECPFGFYGTECSERCNLSCGSKSGQQSISEETSIRKHSTEKENKNTVYALGTVLTLSLLVNIVQAIFRRDGDRPTEQL